MTYRSLLAAALLPLSVSLLHAQDEEPEPMRVERILSVNLDGTNTYGVEVFSRRAPGDSSVYAEAMLKLQDQELWRLPEDFTAFTLDYSITHTDNTVNRHVIVVSARSDNDYQRNWILGWDGSGYINRELPNHGTPNWHGDNTYASREFLGFAEITREWRINPTSLDASPIDDAPYSFEGGALQAQAFQTLTLQSERSGGRAIKVKKGSTLSIEAIDLKGAREIPETEEPISWGNAWLLVRTSNGTTGWARLIDVNTAINGLPWAG